MRNEKVQKLTLTALMAAYHMSYSHFYRLRSHYRVAAPHPFTLATQS